MTAAEIPEASDSNQAEPVQFESTASVRRRRRSNEADGTVSKESGAEETETTDGGKGDVLVVIFVLLVLVAIGGFFWFVYAQISAEANAFASRLGCNDCCGLTG